MTEDLNQATQESTTVNEPTGEEQEEKLTFTREELDDLIQRTSDSRVSKAIATYQKNQDKKQREAEKLKSMSAEERYEFELGERERAVEEKERQLLMYENKSAALSILSDKGLPTKFVDFVLAEDAESMHDNISLIEKEFKKAVRAEVEKRLASPVPSRAIDSGSSLTKEQFRKMKPTELARLQQDDPELFNSLRSTNYK